MGPDDPRDEQWALHYSNHPEVVASWAEQRGRPPNCPCRRCDPQERLPRPDVIEKGEGRMRYHTSLTGEIAIDPPLTWAEVKGDEGRGYTEVGYNTRDSRNALRITLCETKRETDEGILVVKEGVLIEGLDDDPRAGRAGETACAELQEILDRYAKPGRVFEGVIEGSGEDCADMWRLHAVLDGDDRWAAVVHTPTITWP